MNRATYQINFYQNKIDENLYPEATMIGKSCIVVDADDRHIIIAGEGKIKLLIDNEYKIYENVFSVHSYVYDEW